jgi:hypothetical protein
MDFDTSTIMMVFFIIALVVSIWKIYAFLPNKQLEDDDTTDDAQAKLERIMLKVIKIHEGKLNNEELFFKIQEDEDFDSEAFWRFNHNKLNQLLGKYYIKHPDTSSILDIYRGLE